MPNKTSKAITKETHTKFEILKEINKILKNN